jgi:FixJ family two-component response regulator
MRTELPSDPLVCIVDDDAAIRRSLVRLVESLGIRARAFATPDELLEDEPALDDPACFLLDVHLPGMNGFDLYDRLVEAGRRIPVIFVTGDPRADTGARAARADAVACLEKPYDEIALFQALRRAIDRSAARRG